MSQWPCDCAYNGWFAPPCAQCSYEQAKKTVAAYEAPKPETEVERLRRENAELSARLKGLKK